MMIIELLQLWDMLMYYRIHILALFFVIFVLTPACIMKKKSRRYKGPYIGEPMPVTVIVPVYLEDYDKFEKCLTSIQKQNVDQLIVSIDSQDTQLKNIAKSHGAEIISYSQRVGKRQALADAWLKAKNDIVVHVDSDVVLDKDCLREISKPFSDNAIVGVSSNYTSVKNGSRLAFVFSSLIDQNVNMNNKALDGGLVVVDGRCSAWKKDFLLSIRNEFLNDYWMGIRSEIGDDRFLSREALKQGFKTVYQDTAKIFSFSPSTFGDFVGQQIRWRRSGTRFWFKDLREGVNPNKTYFFKCFAYYTSPFIFVLAAALDILYFRLSFSLWAQWWIGLIAIVVGCASVTLLRQLIFFGKALTPRYLVLQGLLGLFVMLPVSVYGALTLRNQRYWITRASDEDGVKKKNGKVLMNMTLLALGLVALMGFVYPVLLCPPHHYH